MDELKLTAQERKTLTLLREVFGKALGLADDAPASRKEDAEAEKSPKTGRVQPPEGEMPENLKVPWKEMSPKQKKALGKWAAKMKGLGMTFTDMSVLSDGIHKDWRFGDLLREMKKK